VSTAVISVVHLQNCIDLRSGERNEVICVQLEGMSDVTEGENRGPTTSPLTDPRVGFYVCRVSSMLRIYPELPVSISACPCEG
jgi:hypothetical protein